MREFEESPMVVGSGDLWRQATQAKFLCAVEDGTLPEDAFRRWLAQDYLFAKGLTTFQAIATAKAPRKPQGLLIAGLSALDEEMDWFESARFSPSNGGIVPRQSGLRCLIRPSLASFPRRPLRSAAPVIEAASPPMACGICACIPDRGLI